PKKADEAFQEAIELMARLVADHPEEPAFRQHLARAQLNRGTVLQDACRYDDAESAYAAAIRLQKALVEADPVTPDYRYELGVSYNTLGVLFIALRPARAAVEARRAVALFERLTLDFPSVPVYHEELALTQNNLAAMLARDLDWEGAERAWRRAYELFEKLAAEHPEVTDYKGEQGMALGNLGWLLLHRQPVRDRGAGLLGAGRDGPLRAPRP